MKGWLRYAKWALTAFITVCAILVFYDTFYQSGALGAFLNKAADVLERQIRKKYPLCRGLRKENIGYAYSNPHCKKHGHCT